jgi:RNA polymerase sigma factor (sigma-70 family)
VGLPGILSVLAPFGFRVVTRSAPRDDGQDHQSAPLPEALPTTMELDVLYRNEQHALVRFFTRYRASPEDARDLVQEAFLRLSRIDLRRSGSISRPAEYLRQIARNLLKDRAKAARRHARDAHVNADDCDLVGVDELARLEARDSLVRLESAIKSLKPKTREIFMAHHLEGLGYAEIAARTGLSVSGVEKQVARAFDHIDRLTGLH